MRVLDVLFWTAILKGLIALIGSSFIGDPELTSLMGIYGGAHLVLAAVLGGAMWIERKKGGQK